MPLTFELPRVARFQRERALRLWRRRLPLLDMDPDVRYAVRAAASDSRGMTEALVSYFWHAYQHYLDKHGTLAYYPGWPSIYGARSDAIEGVSRLAPLWAAYASSPYGEPGMRAAMIASLRRTLVHGTDPTHPGYWGDIGDRSTLICEAADIALALWLSRDVLWKAMADNERARVLCWLRQVVGKKTADNNWHLFVILVDAVLSGLDPVHRFSSVERLDRVRQFARTEGCFSDGPSGQIDFYNAWGFHYALYWLGEIHPECLDTRLHAALGEFCRWYQWLFTTRGLPLFGRSLCYRFAACVPLLACALREAEVVPAGVAMSAYLANWQFFVEEGGLRAGRPTQGVFGDDIRWLDAYSGPASSLWGTRSLVMYLYASRSLNWTSVEPLPLPATCVDSVTRVLALDATLRTHAATASSSVEFGSDRAGGDRVRPFLTGGAKHRLRELVLGVASRSANNLRNAGERHFANSLEAYR